MLANVLLALAVVLIACHLLAQAFRWIGQPAVMGEIVAGILLGPTLLGRVAPAQSGQLFSPASMPSLTILAQLGVIFYMFLLGLEIDFSVIRSRARSSLFIAAISFVTTLAAGAILGFSLHGRLAAEGSSSLIFALFVGVAMATTALPVLARILSENGLEETPLGLMAIACAALNDLLVWCLLAIVIGFAAGRIPSLKMNYVLVKNIEVSGMQISDYRKRKPADMQAAFADIYAMHAAGKLKPLPTKTYLLEQFAQALGDIKDRKVRGRIVLTMGK